MADVGPIGAFTGWLLKPIYAASIFKADNCTVESGSSERIEKTVSNIVQRMEGLTPGKRVFCGDCDEVARADEKEEEEDEDANRSLCSFLKNTLVLPPEPSL